MYSKNNIFETYYNQQIKLKIKAKNYGQISNSIQVSKDKQKIQSSFTIPLLKALNTETGKPYNYLTYSYSNSNYEQKSNFIYYFSKKTRGELNFSHQSLNFKTFFEHSFNYYQTPMQISFKLSQKEIGLHSKCQTKYQSASIDISSDILYELQKKQLKLESFYLDAKYPINSYSFFFKHQMANNKKTELIVQKKIANNIYGIQFFNDKKNHFGCQLGFAKQFWKGNFQVNYNIKKKNLSTSIKKQFNKKFEGQLSLMYPFYQKGFPIGVNLKINI